MTKRDWDRLSPTYFVYREDDEPLVAFRFETQEVNDRRYDWDRKNYTVGVWNAWMRVWGGQEHMTWPEGTPIEEIKKAIMEKDIRITPLEVAAVQAERNEEKDGVD